ncbi:MAG: hypothetical protein ABI205_00180 [Gemmatimonadaceae bacterium]
MFTAFQRHALTYVIVGAVAAGSAACRTAPAVASSPALAVARFSASTAVKREPGMAANGPIGVPPCLEQAHFRGTAYLTRGGMAVLIDDASVAVARQNDKQLDPLMLRVMVADGRHFFGYDNATSYLLSPTVDSAGPIETTWQGMDTLRMLLPWPAGDAPRWLLFSLDYRAVAHNGAISSCDGGIRTDTLRFIRREP